MPTWAMQMGAVQWRLLGIVLRGTSNNTRSTKYMREFNSLLVLESLRVGVCCMQRSAKCAWSLLA